MGKRLKIFLGFLWLSLLFLSSVYLPEAFAQIVKSNCVQTQVGTPGGAPVLPPDCQGGGAQPGPGQTSGPRSTCQGDLVNFGMEKKLLAMGSGRPGTCFTPKWIVMHITAGNEPSATALFNYFNAGAGGRSVGAQFVIDKQGGALQMTESFADKFETAFAVANYNNGAISIEMTQATVFNSKSDVPPAMYTKAVELVKALMGQYKIPLGPNDANWRAPSNANINPPPGVYGHYQLNPESRKDPGDGFMRDFRADLGGAGAPAAPGVDRRL